MNQENKKTMKEFGSWLLLFVEAFFYIIACANCMNWGAKDGEWFVFAAGLVTLGFGAWHGWKRGKRLMNKE